MSSPAKEQIAFLRFLVQAPKQQQIWLLKHITQPQLDALGEVCYNLLYGHRDVTPLQLHRDIIRKVADKTSSVRTRRGMVQNHPRVIVLAVETIFKDDATNGSD